MVSSALSNCCEESAKKQNNHMQIMYNVLYRIIAGYFRGVYISRTANSILVREK